MLAIYSQTHPFRVHKSTQVQVSSSSNSHISLLWTKVQKHSKNVLEQHITVNKTIRIAMSISNYSARLYFFIFHARMWHY